MTELRTKEDLRRYALRWHDGAWWQRTALAKLNRGEVHVIFDRSNEFIYLVRFWLSPAERVDGRWESGDSLLLHWILRADNDEALHDHPWDFTTTILSGAYTERTVYGGPFILGPDEKAMRTRHLRCGLGEFSNPAEHLHEIASITPAEGDIGVWSLVRTGPRRREWGFHPTGKPWQPWREFLGVA